MIIVKSREGEFGWSVYHSGIDATDPADYSIFLHANNARSDDASHWNDTEPTSSVFSVGTNNGTNDSRYLHIAYCWTETTGVSKFGSYAGNATSVDLGFNPAFILIKRTTGTGKDWWVFDNTREVDGAFGDYLIPNQNYSEQTVATAISVSGTTITFPNNWDSSHDGSASSTYIYAAFADTRDAAFWLDQSGNDNDWQPENLDHNDTLLDSPTDNYATLNPLMGNSSYVLSDGNLKCSYASASWLGSQLSTMGMTTGQYYWEVDVNSGSSSIRVLLGIESADNNYLGSTHIGNLTNSVSIYSVGTNFYVNGSATTDAEWVIATGDTVMFAYDADNGTLWIGKNGTWWNGATSSEIAAGTTTNAMTTGLDTSLTWLAGCTVRDGGTVTFNFGQQPFKYDPPA
jgi:hypothetical protein